MARISRWMKLIFNGVNGTCLLWWFTLYAQAKSCIKHCNSHSGLFSCNFGIRQFENVSPFLFALYLNDVEHFVLPWIKCIIRARRSDGDVEVFLKLYVLLYSDDTIVLAETAEELPSALTGVHHYCQDWHLIVNTTKNQDHHHDFLKGQS